jgi:hypothetical protein
VQRRERDELVAVDDRAGAVDRQQAVAVTVEGEADVVAAVAHRAHDALQVRGAAAVVDVATVGRVGEHGDGRAEAAEDLGRRAVRRAVGAVQHDVDVLQREAGEALVQRAQVVLGGAVQVADRADAIGPAGGRLPQALLDRQLGGIGELEAVGAEELDPVVLERVVRRRDDRREVKAQAADQQRCRRRRQDAAEQHVPAGGGDPGGERRLEHRARLARVADDEHARVRPADLACRRGAQGEPQLGRQHLTGDASDTIGAEELAHDPSRVSD